MNKSRYSGSQIMAILKQADAGTPVPELCREHRYYLYMILFKSLRNFLYMAQ